MHLSADDWSAIRLTLELACIVTLLLLLVGTPIAWWLARTRSRLRNVVGCGGGLAHRAAADGAGLLPADRDGARTARSGMLTAALAWEACPSPLPGLVVASVFYSLPFVVQPIQNAFMAMGERPAGGGGNPARLAAGTAFFHVALPLARPGFLTAAILGFAHTVGEFGVVLMIGGNIPDKTQVLSVQIYNHVEAIEYTARPTAWPPAGGVLLRGAAGAVYGETWQDDARFFLPTHRRALGYVFQEAQPVRPPRCGAQPRFRPTPCRQRRPKSGYRFA
jgi:molybdate transport system permease protein